MTEPLAHGIGERQDLPIPVFYAFAGAFAALFVSFMALALLWSDSRFRGERAGRPLSLSFADDPRLRWALRAVGLAAAGGVFAVALLGPDDPEVNPAAHLVYVIFWVGLVPASLLLGPVWRLLNPLRTVHLLCRGRDKGPAPFGYWPAAVGLFAFTWMELVSPEPASTRTLLVFFGAYAAVQLAGAVRYGMQWFDRADAFEVYSSLIGRLSPLGRRDDGTLVLRNPFDGLDALPAAPGLVATVCVLLGSTGYDGFSDAPIWVDSLQSGPLGPTATGTLGLLTAIGLVAALYAAGTALAGAIGRRRGLATQFAHSLVPIAVGYLVAHYFSLFVIDGQQAIILASGLDATPNADIVSPAGIATTQVLAIVAGHVLGVVSAHDRAVRLLPADQAVSGQVPLLLLMVCYTFGGLTLLFAA
jgi:hypothetical protein